MSVSIISLFYSSDERMQLRRAFFFQNCKHMVLSSNNVYVIF